ncbi:MAG: MBL fold metallo-hydrolase [Halobacteriaceae archaeon]
MIHSNWDTWFIQDEVESTKPESVSVWYLGCNGFILRSPNTTIYIDPYFANGNPPRTIRMIPVPMNPADASLCDAVLVTHEHIDHMHPPSYRPLVNDLNATLYAPSAAYKNPDYDGEMLVPNEQKRVIEASDTFSVGDFTVHARGANDPDAIEPVSYVIEHDSGTFFHAGDSRPADEFEETGREFDIDLGVLAFGSVGNIYKPAADEVSRTKWYMDENQIIEAANQLKLHRLLPSHYDMWRGVGADPKVLSEHAASYAYPKIIEPATIGDRFRLDQPGVIQSQSLR